MRKEYKFYTSSKGLEANFNPQEKIILNDYLKYCGITAGKRKLEVYKRYMLQFRDILEKPLNEVTRNDAVEMWSLINHSAYELNSKVMIKRTIKRFLKWYYKDLSMLEGLKNQSPVINEKKINQNNLITPQEILFAPGWDKQKWFDLLDIWTAWHLKKDIPREVIDTINSWPNADIDPAWI